MTTVDRAQPASAQTQTGMTINDIYRQSIQGVVDITVDSNGGTSPFGGSQSSQAEGSGFVYDKAGDIVTNEHVVAGATSITVKLWNGKEYKARLIGTDNSTDLAVVRISAPSSLIHPLTLGNSAAVQVGDSVIAIGSPFGLAGTVTSGIISALHRSIESPNNFTIGDSIQTDAPINHGNSGGPLIDMSGHVIGVNAQIQSDSGGSDGVGFAIPANTVSSVVSQIAAGKTVAHAYFGVQVQDSTSPQGALLASVLSGTPAAKAGLKSGDVVTKLDGTVITNQSDLSSVIEGKKPGDKLAVTFSRAARPTPSPSRSGRAAPDARDEQAKLIAGTAAVAIAAGGGAAIAATQLTSSSTARATRRRPRSAPGRAASTDGSTGAGARVPQLRRPGAAAGRTPSTRRQPTSGCPPRRSSPISRAARRSHSSRRPTARRPTASSSALVAAQKKQLDAAVAAGQLSQVAGAVGRTVPHPADQGSRQRHPRRAPARLRRRRRRRRLRSGGGLRGRRLRRRWGRRRLGGTSGGTGGSTGTF